MKKQTSYNQEHLYPTRILLLGIWEHLTRHHRIQLGLLVVVMLASGGAEFVSLAAVLPFLVVLSDPEKLWQQPWVESLAAQIGWTEASQLLLPATLTFALAAVVAAMIRLANLGLNGRLAAAIGSDLSCECYRRTLYQPYQVHVQRNSAAVIAGTTTKIGITVVALNLLLQLITSSVVAVGLLTGLLLVNALAAMTAVVLFGSAYGLLAITTKRAMTRNGQRISIASNQQLKALQEGLGAIRDVLLGGSQNAYIKIYREADRPQRQLQAQNVFLSTFPRFVIEALGLVAIALLGGLMVLKRGGGADVIPLLGVMAVGAQRLLPALQQIYHGWAQLKGYSAAIQDVLAMLNQPIPPIISVDKPLLLTESIRLEGVYFRYEPGEPDVLSGLDLEIRLGERIGLIGTTGSGKSTTVDLLMGLLEPSNGRVLVDGFDLHDPDYPERLLAWRAAIAHVPQNIFLADSSIAENIAFGVPSNQIDLARVKEAASQAQIAAFIESSPGGFSGFVGERGVRLSGGQRQRIGIARALYKKSKVLIFDEATSALDTGTEEALMNSIEALGRDLTILMIAHRLNTVKKCDKIIELDCGKIKNVIDF